MADPEMDVYVGYDAEDLWGNASEEMIPGVLGGIGKTSLVDYIEVIGADLSDPLRDLCLNHGHQ